LSEFSDLSVSQVNFNTVTHGGLKSSQSYPSGNAPPPQSSLQQTTSRPIASSPVENEATVILTPIPPRASEAWSSQTQNKDIPQQPPPDPPEWKSIITLKALQDYTTGIGDVLSFKKGDLITFAKKINEDWWKGTIGRRIGYVPSTHVQLMPSNFGSTQFDPEVQLDPATSVPARVKALYDYSAREPSDLEFRKGDIIYVLEVKNKDWWKGAVEGREGLFPTNHVESLPPTTSVVFHLAQVRKLRNGTVPVHSFQQPFQSVNIPHHPAPSRAPAVPHRPTPPTSQYPINRADRNDIDYRAGKELQICYSDFEVPTGRCA
jgi:hypothetical protein